MDENYIVIDGVVYSADKRILMKYPADKAGECFYIPDFVEELGDGCFASVDNVKHIIIGKNVKKIGRRGDTKVRYQKEAAAFFLNATAPLHLSASSPCKRRHPFRL